MNKDKLIEVGFYVLVSLVLISFIHDSIVTEEVRFRGVYTKQTEPFSYWLFVSFLASGFLYSTYKAWKSIRQKIKEK